MTTPSTYNRPLFAELLKQAIGGRSINQFALHCGVSAAYISRLLRQKTKTPPNPPIILKMANKAHNQISYLHLMTAAGYLQSEPVNWPPLKEHNPPYAPDLAEMLRQSVIKYKGHPVDEDTKFIIKAILEKIIKPNIRE